MPIKDSNDEVIGVAQAINKTSIHDEPFNEHDEKVGLKWLIEGCLGRVSLTECSHLGCSE